MTFPASAVLPFLCGRARSLIAPLLQQAAPQISGSSSRLYSISAWQRSSSISRAMASSPVVISGSGAPPPPTGPPNTMPPLFLQQLARSFASAPAAAAAAAVAEAAAPAPNSAAAAAPKLPADPAAAMSALRRLPAPIDRYLALRRLLAEAPHAYYALLLSHTEEILPFVYTPTVGEACQRYHRLPLEPHGLYLTLDDRGRVLEKLRAWERAHRARTGRGSGSSNGSADNSSGAGDDGGVSVVVVTDGERILGLGDLGANGMGISEGKIALYTVAAGLDPERCLPVCVDVGTNNAALLADPAYKGLRRRRPDRAGFDAFMAEVMAAFKAWRPHVLVQFEDFGNSNAFRLLDDYRHGACVFNDDIQGTAAITLAGLLSAARATGRPLREHRVLFLGAGEAGTGIGELIAHYMALRHGTTLEEGRRRCYFLDSKGLVCASRANDLQHHKLPFAHDVPYCRDLASAVAALEPTALIGVSTIGGAFTEPVLREMARLNDRPIVFPLSNPTAHSECTFEQALAWTGGRVLFASGSPFDPARPPGGFEPWHPAQANNVYIFPALGAAAVATRAKSLPDEAFVVAAEALAAMAPPGDAARGRLFPPFASIRSASARVAAAVAALAVERGWGTAPAGVAPRATLGEWTAHFARGMWGSDMQAGSKL